MAKTGYDLLGINNIGELGRIPDKRSFVPSPNTDKGQQEDTADLSVTSYLNDNKFWGTEKDSPLWGKDVYDRRTNRLAQFGDSANNGDGVMGFLNDFTDSAQSGALGMGAGFFKYAGDTLNSEMMKNWGDAMQERAEYNAIDPEKLNSSSAAWWANATGNAVGSSVPTMIGFAALSALAPATATGTTAAGLAVVANANKVGKAAQMLSKLKTFGKTAEVAEAAAGSNAGRGLLSNLVQGATSNGGILQRIQTARYLGNIPEAMSEAGNAMDEFDRKNAERIARGEKPLSETDRFIAKHGTALGNFVFLSAMDKLEAGMENAVLNKGFTSKGKEWLKRVGPTGMEKTPWADVAMRSVAMAGPNALKEGAEEAGQNIISSVAKGEKIDTDQLIEEAKMGAAGGLLLGSATGAISSRHDNVRRAKIGDTNFAVQQVGYDEAGNSISNYFVNNKEVTAEEFYDKYNKEVPENEKVDYKNESMDNPSEFNFGMDAETIDKFHEAQRGLTATENYKELLGNDILNDTGYVDESGNAVVEDIVGKLSPTPHEAQRVISAWEKVQKEHPEIAGKLDNKSANKVRYNLRKRDAYDSARQADIRTAHDVVSAQEQQGIKDVTTEWHKAISEADTKESVQNNGEKAFYESNIEWLKDDNSPIPKGERTQLLSEVADDTIPEADKIEHINTFARYNSYAPRFAHPQNQARYEESAKAHSGETIVPQGTPVNAPQEAKAETTPVSEVKSETVNTETEEAKKAPVTDENVHEEQAETKSTKETVEQPVKEGTKEATEKTAEQSKEQPKQEVKQEPVKGNEVRVGEFKLDKQAYAQDKSVLRWTLPETHKNKDLVAYIKVNPDKKTVSFSVRSENENGNTTVYEDPKKYSSLSEAKEALAKYNSSSLHSQNQIDEHGRSSVVDKRTDAQKEEDALLEKLPYQYRQSSDNIGLRILKNDDIEALMDVIDIGDTNLSTIQGMTNYDAKLTFNNFVNLLKNAGVKIETDPQALADYLINKCGCDSAVVEENGDVTYTKGEHTATLNGHQADNGVTYVNGIGFNLDTPFHEYVHIWWKEMFGDAKSAKDLTDPEKIQLWNEIEAVVKETPVFNSITTRKDLIEEYHNYALEEAFCRIVGNYSTQLSYNFGSMMKDATKKNRFRKAAFNFFDKMLKSLGFKGLKSKSHGVEDLMKMPIAPVLQANAALYNNLLETPTSEIKAKGVKQDDDKDNTAEEAVENDEIIAAEKAAATFSDALDVSPDLSEQQALEEIQSASRTSAIDKWLKAYNIAHNFSLTAEQEANYSDLLNSKLKIPEELIEIAAKNQSRGFTITRTDGSTPKKVPVKALAGSLAVARANGMLTNNLATKEQFDSIYSSLKEENPELANAISREDFEFVFNSFADNVQKHTNYERKSFKGVDGNSNYVDDYSKFVKGKDLNDFFGKDDEKAVYEYLNDAQIIKRVFDDKGEIKDVEVIDLLQKGWKHQAKPVAFYLNSLLGKGNDATMNTFEAGSGKTYMSTAMIQEILKANPKAKILVLAGVDTTLNSWKVAFGQQGLHFVQANTPTFKNYVDDNIHICTYKSLKKVLDVEWDYIFADECQNIQSKSNKKGTTDKNSTSTMMDWLTGVGKHPTNKELPIRQHRPKTMYISATPMPYIENITSYKSLYNNDIKGLVGNILNKLVEKGKTDKDGLLDDYVTIREYEDKNGVKLITQDEVFDNRRGDNSSFINFIYGISEGVNMEKLGEETRDTVLSRIETIYKQERDRYERELTEYNDASKRHREWHQGNIEYHAWLNDAEAMSGTSTEEKAEKARQSFGRAKAFAQLAAVSLYLGDTRLLTELNKLPEKYMSVDEKMKLKGEIYKFRDAIVKYESSPKGSNRTKFKTEFAEKEYTNAIVNSMRHLNVLSNGRPHTLLPINFPGSSIERYMTHPSAAQLRLTKDTAEGHNLSVYNGRYLTVTSPDGKSIFLEKDIGDWMYYFDYLIPSDDMMKLRPLFKAINIPTNKRITWGELLKELATTPYDISVESPKFFDFTHPYTLSTDRVNHNKTQYRTDANGRRSVSQLGAQDYMKQLYVVAEHVSNYSDREGKDTTVKRYYTLNNLYATQLLNQYNYDTNIGAARDANGKIIVPDRFNKFLDHREPLVPEKPQEPKRREYDPDRVVLYEKSKELKSLITQGTISSALDVAKPVWGLSQDALYEIDEMLSPTASVSDLERMLNELKGTDAYKLCKARYNILQREKCAKELYNLVIHGKVIPKRLMPLYINVLKRAEAFSQSLKDDYSAMYGDASSVSTDAYFSATTMRYGNSKYKSLFDNLENITDGELTLREIFSASNDDNAFSVASGFKKFAEVIKAMSEIELIQDRIKSGKAPNEKYILVTNYTGKLSHNPFKLNSQQITYLAIKAVLNQNPSIQKAVNEAYQDARRDGRVRTEDKDEFVYQMLYNNKIVTDKTAKYQKQYDKYAEANQSLIDEFDSQFKDKSVTDAILSLLPEDLRKQAFKIDDSVTGGLDENGSTLRDRLIKSFNTGVYEQDIYDNDGNLLAKAGDKCNILVGSLGTIREGVSFHHAERKVDGKVVSKADEHRYMSFLFTPDRPFTIEQVVKRIFRAGTQSNSTYHLPLLGLSSELRGWRKCLLEGQIMTSASRGENADYMYLSMYLELENALVESENKYEDGASGVEANDRKYANDERVGFNAIRARKTADDVVEKADIGGRSSVIGDKKKRALTKSVHRYLTSKLRDIQNALAENDYNKAISIFVNSDISKEKDYQTITENGKIYNYKAVKNVFLISSTSLRAETISEIEKWDKEHINKLAHIAEKLDYLYRDKYRNSHQTNKCIAVLKDGSKVNITHAEETAIRYVKGITLKDILYKDDVGGDIEAIINSEPSEVYRKLLKTISKFKSDTAVFEFIDNLDKVSDADKAVCGWRFKASDKKKFEWFRPQLKTDEEAQKKDIARAAGKAVAILNAKGMGDKVKYEEKGRFHEYYTPYTPTASDIKPLEKVATGKDAKLKKIKKEFSSVFFNHPVYLDNPELVDSILLLEDKETTAPEDLTKQSKRLIEEAEKLIALVKENDEESYQEYLDALEERKLIQEHKKKAEVKSDDDHEISSAEFPIYSLYYEDEESSEPYPDFADLVDVRASEWTNKWSEVSEKKLPIDQKYNLKDLILCELEARYQEHEDAQNGIGGKSSVTHQKVRESTINNLSKHFPSLKEDNDIVELKKNVYYSHENEAVFGSDMRDILTVENYNTESDSFAEKYHLSDTEMDAIEKAINTVNPVDKSPLILGKSMMVRADKPNSFIKYANIDHAKYLYDIGTFSNREIFYKTGCFKDRDGEWKTWINDSKDGISEDLINNPRALENGVKLSEFYKNVMLYLNCPYLRNIVVRIEKLAENEFGYTKEGNIVLSADLFKQPYAIEESDYTATVLSREEYEISMRLHEHSLKSLPKEIEKTKHEGNTALVRRLEEAYQNALSKSYKVVSPNEALDILRANIAKTLFHEVQHVIQSAEGFASGGNDAIVLDMLRNEAVYINTLLTESPVLDVAHFEETQGLLSMMTKKVNDTPREKLALWKKIASEIVNDESLPFTKANIQMLKEKNEKALEFAERETRKLQADANRLVKLLEDYKNAPISKRVEMDAMHYYLLHGEVEARRAGFLANHGNGNNYYQFIPFGIAKAAFKNALKQANDYSKAYTSLPAQVKKAFDRYVDRRFEYNGEVDDYSWKTLAEAIPDRITYQKLKKIKDLMDNYINKSRESYDLLFEVINKGTLKGERDIALAGANRSLVVNSPNTHTKKLTAFKVPQNTVTAMADSEKAFAGLSNIGGRSSVSSKGRSSVTSPNNKPITHVDKFNRGIISEDTNGFFGQFWDLINIKDPKGTFKDEKSFVTEKIKALGKLFYVGIFDKNHAIYDLEEFSLRVTGMQLLSHDSYYEMVQGAPTRASGLTKALTIGSKKTVDQANILLGTKGTKNELNALGTMENVMLKFQEILESDNQQAKDFLARYGNGSNTREAAGRYLAAVILYARNKEWEKGFPKRLSDAQRKGHRLAFTPYKMPVVEIGGKKVAMTIDDVIGVLKDAGWNFDKSRKSVFGYTKYYEDRRGDIFDQGAEFYDTVEYDIDGTILHHVGDRKHGKFYDTAAGRYQELNKNIQRILVHTGVISDELRTALEEHMPDYAPMIRDFSNTAAVDSHYGRLTSGGSGIGNIRSMLNSISEEGSTRIIKNPLEITIQAIGVASNRAVRNQIGQHVVESIRDVLIQNVKDVKAGKIGPDGKKVQLLREEDMPIVKCPEYMQKNAKAEPENCIFTVMFDGKKVAYRCVNKDLYQPIVGYDAITTNALLKIAMKPTEWMRRGSTLAPAFIVRNFLRDTVFASISSQNGFIPFISSIKGLQLLNDEDWLAKMEAAGIGQFNYVSDGLERQNNLHDIIVNGRNYTYKSALKDMAKFVQYLFTLQAKKLGQPLGNVGSYLGGVLEKVSDKAEMSTRMGEFYLAYNNAKKGKVKQLVKTADGKHKKVNAAPMSEKEALEYAANCARNVTLDFSRSGSVGRQVNRWVPFFNANLQGADKMVHLLIDPATREKSAMALTSMAAFTVALWALQIGYDDPEKRRKMNAGVRYSNWLIPVGEERYIKLPKPQEAGVTFASMLEALLDMWYLKEPGAATKWAREAIDTVFPEIMPTIIAPYFEWRANYNMLTGKPVVANRLLRLKNEDQYTPSTTELSKYISKKLSGTWLDNTIGMSPIKIDNTIRGYGGTWRYQLATLAGILSPDWDRKPSKGALNNYPLRDFVTNYANNSEYLTEYYAFTSNLDREVQSDEGIGKKAAEKATIGKIRQEYNIISKNNAKIRALNNDQDYKEKNNNNVVTKIYRYSKLSAEAKEAEIKKLTEENQMKAKECLMKYNPEYGGHLLSAGSAQIKLPKKRNGFTLK